ncbi:MAG: membrane protein insertase YidC [Fimbriimonadaceae bacterium]|nr:membrane protein insertase YidC [Chitinophagales bacterium]
MDRRSVIGFILIGILFVGYLLVQSNYSQKAQIAEGMRQDSIKQVRQAEIADSLKHAKQLQEEAAKFPQSIDSLIAQNKNAAQITILEDSLRALKQKQILGPFADAVQKTEEFFTLENDVLKIIFTNRGGRIKTVELKKYKDYRGGPLDLINSENNKFGYTFYFNTDKLISTDSLYFQPIIDPSGKKITFRLPGGEGKYFDQVYAFTDTSYLLDYNLQLTGFNEVIPAQLPLLILNWQNEMQEQEKNIDYERQYSKLYFSYANGDMDYKSSNGKIDFDSKIKWVSCQQQFFNATLIAKNEFDNQGYINIYSEDTSSFVKLCNTELYIPYSNQKDFSFPMQYYFAPNEYAALKKLDIGLEDIVPMGTGMIRWLNQWVIVPVFHWLGNFVTNYGLVILLLTLIIKLALTPLTYRSYLSMAKMRVLNPEVAEIREKYKDDQAKLGQEQLKLFRKAGVNPLGGCIPTLLSMPILIAVFRLFPGSIDLRQEGFLWANDLSTYDDLIKLGINLPFGIGSHISLFCVLMTISSIMYVRVNMSQTANLPKEMKFMQYLMPVFFFFFLNSSPAGLTYYYFVSNMVTFAQQWGIRRFFINDEAIHAKIQENKAKPVKKSGFQARLEEAMKKQQQIKQGKGQQQKTKKK